MSNFTKSIVYSGVVLAVGLIAIFAIRSNMEQGTSFSSIEPAAGEVSTMTDGATPADGLTQTTTTEQPAATTSYDTAPSEAAVEAAEDAQDSAVEATQAAEEAQDAAEEAQEAAQSAEEAAEDAGTFEPAAGATDSTETPQ